MATDNEVIDRLLPMVRRAEKSADDAVSPAGAIGRYQIMPKTARALGHNDSYEALKDPNYSETVARSAIQDLINQHGHDDKAILAGYNASPPAVRRWKAAGRNDLVLPQETQDYFGRAGYTEEPRQPTYVAVQGPAGKQEYQKLLDSGFSKAEADTWAHDQAETLRSGGFSEKEVSEYFDDPPYHVKGMETLAKKQIDMLPKDEHEKVAGDWVQSLIGGLQTSAVGLQVRGVAPDIVNPEKAGFAQNLAYQGGMMLGDLPYAIGGFALGAVAGAPRGAAMGAAVPIAGETGVGEVVGALTTGGIAANAASAALPEAIRGHLLDSYRNPNGHKTWTDWASAYSGIAWQTAKAAFTGAVGGAAGAKAAGAVEKIGGKTIAQTAAFGLAAAPASVATGAALEGRVPNAEDFTAGAALTVGLGLSGHVVGAARRFVPSKATEAVQTNMEDLYRRTGIHPAEAQEAAKNDVVMQGEILSRNADGTQETPEFDAGRPSEPEISPEEAASRIAAMARSAKAEGSLDAEKLTTDTEQHLAAAEFQKQIDAMIEPDPATAPISEERALTVRLEQVGETEPQMLEPTPPGAGGKPPGEPPIIEGEFREVPPQKQIGDKMPLGDAEKIVDGFIGEKPDKPRPWWNPMTMYRGYITELAKSRSLDRELDSDPKKAGVEDMLRQVYGAKGRTGYFVRYGIVKLGRDPKTGDIAYNETPGKSMWAAFEKARELGGTEDGLVRYWVSARALALDARGITSGLNSVAARRVIEETGKIYHPALKMLQENNFAVVDYVRDSGVFSAKRAQAMKDLNPFHIVFQRVVDPTYNPVGRGFGPRQPVKTIEGSDRKIVPPIPAQVDNMHTMIAMADRNLAVGRLLEGYAKLASLDPEAAKAIEFKDSLDPKALIEDYNRMPLKDRVDEEGNPIPASDAEALIPLLAQKAFFSKRGPNDFLYFNKGIPEIYTARDPETALLLRASQPQGEAHAALKIMEGFANISRLGIVSLPEFPLRTGLRSQFEAAIRSEHAGIPGHAWLQGVWHAFGQTEKFQQFMKDGGFGSSVVDIDEKYIQRDVAALFEKTGTWDRIWNVARHPLEALHKYRQMIENAGRLGYWRRAQDAGLSGGKAAMQSRRAFGDNAEKAGLQVMNSWAKITMFMRPSVLDLAYFGQAMRSRPGQTIAAGAALVTVPTIANFVANKMYDDDKENNPQYRADHPEYVPYSELPRWQKDMMMVLPPIGGVRMRLPTVPYTSGFIFHTMAERFLSYAYDHDPRAFREWGQTFLAQFMPPVIPALALPVYEATFDIRQGSGAPLIPASVERASPDMQYTRNTSETAKAVSRVLGNVGVDQSPIALDNYVREWTGPIPSQIIRALDGTVSADNRPWQIADIPMIGAFVTRHPDMNAQPIEDFFSQMKLFEAKHQDIALAIRNQDFTALPRALQDPRGLMTMTQMTRVSSAISAQANVLRTMNTSKMTNAEKQKYMDAGYNQIVQQAKAALQVLDSVPSEFK